VGAPRRPERDGTLRRVRCSILHFDDIEPVETDLVEAQWKPVRHAFGITAFGTNAYLARHPGDLLIEDHSEGAGVEELYVILRGEVEFLLERENGEDETILVRSGTLIGVPPHLGRAARAVTADAAVLAIGAVPGKPFVVSDWEKTRLPG